MTMTKKSSEFLRHFIIGDWIFSWFNIRPISFTDNFSFCEELAELRLCGFCFSLLIASQKQIHSLSTHNLRTVFQRFPSRCRPAPCSSSLWPICSKPLEMIHEWEWPLFKDSILISTPYLPCRQQVVTSGSNLGVPSNPTCWFRWVSISWQSVLTTSHWLCELWEFFNFFCHDVLSDFNCGQESCVSTNLYHSILLWKPFHSFLLLLH